MREAVARENGFALYRLYSEPEVAAFLRVDLSTLKKWRRAGKVPYVNLGERKIRMMGYMIADCMMGLHKVEDAPLREN